MFDGLSSGDSVYAESSQCHLPTNREEESVNRTRKGFSSVDVATQCICYTSCVVNSSRLEILVILSVQEGGF